MIVSFRKGGPGSEEERECRSAGRAHISTPRRAGGSVAMGVLKFELGMKNDSLVIANQQRTGTVRRLE